MSTDTLPIEQTDIEIVKQHNKTQFENCDWLAIHFLKKGNKTPNQTERSRRRGVVIGYIKNGVPFVGWSLCDKRDRDSGLFNEDRAMYIALTRARSVIVYGSVTDFSDCPESLKSILARVICRTLTVVVNRSIFKS